MYRLPSDKHVAQAVVDVRFREFWLRRISNFSSLRRLAKDLKQVEKKYRGSYVLLSDLDLAYFGQLGIFEHTGSLPTSDPILPMIGARRLRQLGTAGFGLQLIYDHNPDVVNGLFIVLVEDIK
jgi:hypothetical protein